MGIIIGIIILVIIGSVIKSWIDNMSDVAGVVIALIAIIAVIVYLIIAFPNLMKTIGILALIFIVGAAIFFGIKALIGYFDNKRCQKKVSKTYQLLKKYSIETGGFTLDEAREFCQNNVTDYNYDDFQKAIYMLINNNVVTKIPIGNNRYLYKSQNMKSRTIKM